MSTCGQTNHAENTPHQLFSNGADAPVRNMDRGQVRFGLAAALILVALCAGMLLDPNTAYAARDYTTPGGIHVTSPQDVELNYHTEEKVLEIYAKHGQSITLSGNSEGEAVNLGMQGTMYGHVDLTFKDLTIDARSNGNGPAFRWSVGSVGSDVTLALEGKNALYSGWGYAGLQKDENQGLNIGNVHTWDPTTGDFYATQGPEKDKGKGNPWLHITGDGELTAEGGTGGAGIGGGSLDAKQSADAGYIAIGDVDGRRNPTVIAKGGAGAAGIGGGKGSNDRDQPLFGEADSNYGPLAQGVYILIRSGNVTATGGASQTTSGAGIGGGYGGRGENIWISGGVVSATGSGVAESGAPAIGAGGEGAAHNIFITGGVVHAVAPSIGGVGEGGVVSPSYPFGDGSWRPFHFVDKPVMKITGGAVDLSGSWETFDRDGQHLIISSKKSISATVTGGVFGGAHAEQGKAGVGKIYGQDIAADHIVLHNTDTSTSERFPWKVEKGTNEFVVSDGTEGSDYSYKNGVLTVLSSKSLTISNRPGVVEAVSDRIVLNAQLYSVGMKNLTIVRPKDATGDGGAPFLVKGGVSGTVFLNGPVVLKAGGTSAGFQVEEGGIVSIAAPQQPDARTNYLDASGSGGGAGIGGASGKTTGKIRVSSGYIKAQGADGGSPMGSGKGVDTPKGSVALLGGYYGDQNGTEGTASTGRVYGVAPYSDANNVRAVVRNTNESTSQEYPFAVVVAEKAGDTLVIFGEWLIEGIHYSYSESDNVLTVKTSDPVTIALAPDAKQSGTRIVVSNDMSDEPANITLLKLKLDMNVADPGFSDPNGGSAVGLESPARIVLSGENSIRAGVDGAAIANAGNDLIISGEGSLDAHATGNAAAIGGTADNPAASNITIKSGDIKAMVEQPCVAAIGSAATLNGDGGSIMAPARNIVVEGGKFALSNVQLGEGDPLLGGGEGSTVKLSAGYFADASAVPGGAGVGSVYGATPSAGYRLVKTTDTALAVSHPYEVIADTRVFQVHTANGPAQEYVDYTYLDGILKIMSETPVTVSYINPDVGMTKDVIVIDLPDAEQTAHVAIDSLLIEWTNAPFSNKSSPIDVARGNLELELIGRSELYGGYHPAIGCNGGALRIAGEGELLAHATAGNGINPTIGTTDNKAADIEIAGGTVRAIQSNAEFSSTPVIGCGKYGSVKSIAITGGRLEVSVPKSAKPMGTATSTENVCITGGAFAQGVVEDNTVYGISPMMGYRVVATGDVAFPVAVELAPCDFVVQGSDVVFGRDWLHDPDVGVISIVSDKPMNISMSETLAYESTRKGGAGHTSEVLVINPGDGDVANVTLNGVKVDGRSQEAAAIGVSSGSLELTLASGSTNSLIGGDEMPALHNGSGPLSIASDEEAPGVLYAQGGMLAAGIGGARGEAGKNIEISGGEILARGGSRAAGIGGGYKCGEPSDVVITGGRVDASAGQLQEDDADPISNGEFSTESDITLKGGEFADAQAQYAEDADERGIVYNIMPAPGYAVFPIEDGAYTAGVFPLAETEVLQSASKVPYDGEPIQPGDILLGVDDGDPSAVLATWLDAEGVELESAPVTVGEYSVHVVRSAHVEDGVGHLPFEGTFKFTITPRELVISGATAEPRQYDGTEDASVEFAFAGAAPQDVPTATYASAQWESSRARETKFSVKGIALEGADVNPANRNYTLNADSYAGEVPEGQGIVPRVLDVGWIDPGRVVGDGKQIGAEERNEGTRALMKTDGVSLAVDGGDADTVGEHTAVAALVGAPDACANYELLAEQAEHAYRVAAAPAAIGASFDHADGVYTYGEDIVVSGFVAAGNLLGNSVESSAPEDAEAIDGTAEANDSAGTDRDLAVGTSGSGEVALFAGDSELVRAEVAPDGSFSLVLPTADKRLSTGVHADLSLAYGGSYDLSANRVELRQISVRKAPLDVTVSGSASKVYDGTAELPSTDGISLKLTGAIANDTPTAQVSCTLAGNAVGSSPINVRVEVAEGWDAWYKVEAVRNETVGSILPRTVELTWSGVEQIVGDHVFVAATVSNLVEGDDVAVVVENASSDKAGEHVARAVSLSGADAGNYRLAEGSKSEVTYRVVSAPDTGEGEGQSEGAQGGGNQASGDAGQGGNGGAGITPPNRGQQASGTGTDSPGGPATSHGSLPRTGDGSAISAVLMDVGLMAVLAGALLRRAR